MTFLLFGLSFWSDTDPWIGWGKLIKVIIVSMPEKAMIVSKPKASFRSSQFRNPEKLSKPKKLYHLRYMQFIGSKPDNSLFQNSEELS